MQYVKFLASRMAVACFVALLCAGSFAVAYADEGVAPVSDITDAEISSVVSGLPATLDLSDEVNVNSVQSYAGVDRYETNSLQAMDGWEYSDWAIVTTGEKWADALAAAGLAGALECPILLTKPDSLPSYTLTALKDLGIKKVIILGDENAVSLNVETELEGEGIVIEERLKGDDRYGTQIAIFNYGLSQGFWDASVLVVACGADGCFADALSVSPAAYAKQLPIFLTNSEGALSNEQKTLLLDAAKEHVFTQAVILGGETRITEITEGFLWGVIQLSSGKSKAVQRLAGSDRYETSSLIAEWAISSGFLKADQSAFASGVTPYDSLGGGAMQGEAGSVLLLVADGNCGKALAVLSEASDITEIRFFGGSDRISDETRALVVESLGLRYIEVVDRLYAVTFERALAIEAAVSSFSSEEISSKMNPSSWLPEDAGYYQFAILSNGYSGAVTAEQLNSYIENSVVYKETSSGATSTLRGMGDCIVNASRTYGVNEVYLLSHAALESAWGTSSLAQGFEYDGVTEIGGQVYPAGTYYNFFGIGAFDSSPLGGGCDMAVQNGWDSPEKAILGGAAWISSNYINPTVSSASVSRSQDTLYKMRWDIARIEAQGSCWHQYATSLTWAEGIAKVMGDCYADLGVSIYDTGLSYEVPRYSE